MAMNLGNSDMDASRIALGCMRMEKLSVQEAGKLVNIALEQGITLFDHADIYGAGRSEEIFGRVLSENKGMRDRMRIQTKCGIRDGYYDSSAAHIVSAVEESLKRLQIDCIDLLLLHRPDALMEVDEVAEALHRLEHWGLVRQFGVSNFNKTQLELLQSACKEPFLVNQVQFGLMHAGMVSQGIAAQSGKASGRELEVMDYCRLNGITIQAWSPLQYGFFEGTFIDNEKFPELNICLEKLTKRYNVTKAAIAVAWILRHPANIQVIVGTMAQEHLKEVCRASEIRLSRQEWYELYKAAGYELP
ncbi:MAG: aldo/keto reductase [Lachnospiraceae bacterium]|nr:aldo/keto reductase [Lachnospiraceae bacterium]